VAEGLTAFLMMQVILAAYSTSYPPCTIGQTVTEVTKALVNCLKGEYLKVQSENTFLIKNLLYDS
jgi:hypothetical protein